MNNQELLFNLLQKLASQEIELILGDHDNLFLRDKTSQKEIYLGSLEIKEYDCWLAPYQPEKNDKFKESFIKKNNNN